MVAFLEGIGAALAAARLGSKLAAVVGPAAGVGGLGGHAAGGAAHAAFVVVGVGPVGVQLEAFHARGAADVGVHLRHVAPAADELLAAAARGGLGPRGSGLRGVRLASGGVG